MRIHRIHLRHVAGVDDRELHFDDGVTVVVGPNEAGKSTIATALQLLLEEKDRYDNADIRAVRPVHVDADPTVELECTTGPYHVTYRKVFGRTAGRRETSLVVHAPTPASLTGDAAHDRMSEILDETVDEELWAALRVQQRHDVGQADLTASRALAAALDAAGSGSASLAEDGSLVARVEEAAGVYWTDLGRERRPLLEADEQVTTAREALVEARTRLDAVREATAQHDLLVDRLADWRASLPELQARQKETAEALAAVDERRDALRTARREVADAETTATGARDEAGDRAALVRRVDDLGAVLQRRDEDVLRAEAAASDAAGRVTAARRERDDARDVAREARRRLRHAEGDVRLLRLQLDVRRLTTRIAEAEAVHRRREEAKGRLDEAAPSAAVLRRLEGLEDEVRRTAAVLAADLPRLRVSGPTGATVTVDGEAVALGEVALERTVDGELAVQVGDVTVAVVPGASATELADAHADAQHALERALEEAGVADVAAARARRETTVAARRELEQTEEEWRRVTAVDGLDGLRASLARADGAVDELTQQRPADRPMPDDVAHAELLVDTLQGEVADAEAVVESAEAALDTATDAATASRAAAAEAVAARDHTATQLAEESQRLETARAGVADDALDDAVELAEEALAAAGRARDRAAAALASLDVASIEADAEAAAARLESTRQQLRDADLERARLWGTIEASAASGLGERVPQLEAVLADAEDRRDGLRLQADALLLLRDTLHRHRDAARSRYRAPLQREIERLGRVVFGDGFGVTLDEHLRVVERTLGGRTLDLDQLSGGAQEQLAIITRLAAAGLVDGEDGVPLILDDALGYADPSRADRVNTLLAETGTRSQLIVLTCDPDRFGGIRGAHRIDLRG